MTPKDPAQEQELTDTERVGLAMILSVQGALRTVFPDSTPVQHKAFTEQLAQSMAAKGLSIHGE